MQSIFHGHRFIRCKSILKRWEHRFSARSTARFGGNYTHVRHQGPRLH